MIPLNSCSGVIETAACMSPADDIRLDVLLTMLCSYFDGRPYGFLLSSSPNVVPHLVW